MDQSQRKEIEDRFSFKVPHYVPSKAQFAWLKRRNMKQPLLTEGGCLPIGLLPDLSSFLDHQEYGYKIEGNFGSTNFSEIEALEFVKSLNLPDKYEVRDYQLKYFVKGVRNRRMICIAPTNAGKTLLTYLFFRYFNCKMLITVPSTTLVWQTIQAFKDYGYEGDGVHGVVAGIAKETRKLCTISTWQSIQEQDRTFFEQFEAVLGDEAHTNAGQKLQSIMNMLTNAKFRLGLTGSMPDEPLYKNIIVGCFGPVMTFITNEEMIHRGFSSECVIKMIRLNHNVDLDSPWDYETERDWLLKNENRNEFIVNLVLSLKGNTFVMFKNISHGKHLYGRLKARADIPTYYVAGETSTADRQKLIKLVETSKDSITVASTVFATGVDISSIDNMVIVHPSKSKVKLLQTVGRGLRKNVNKPLLTYIDLWDKVASSEEVVNTTMNHAAERGRIYKREKFKVKTYSVNL
jgi:superfamily II DNA or RNA helicase